MIIPRYWAEASTRHRAHRKQITVHRFGWSSHSPEEAQANADARAAEALQRILAGEKLARREPKVPYNGAEGVPIREEIIAEYDAAVITRNSYGALCLNTPGVLFADVDFASPDNSQLGCTIALLLCMLGAILGWAMESWLPVLVVGGLSIAVGRLVAWIVRRAQQAMRGDSEKLARNRVQAFADAHPDWRLRLYRTPAGLRVLVLHRTFDPDEPAVAELFTALGTDPVYVTMCRRQRCFRARVSPKPWRIGMESHLKPRPGIWPIRAEHMPRRAAWVRTYEEKSAGFAACRFEGEWGAGHPHPVAKAVQLLHDTLARADSSLPIA